MGVKQFLGIKWIENTPQLYLNEKYGFFNNIIPLEHPRFIMQYNSKDKEIFLEKYLNALNNV